MVGHVLAAHEVHQREQVFHRLAYRRIRLLRALIRHGTHHFLAKRLLVVDKIDAVALALSHLAGAVETGHFHRLTAEVEVDGFAEVVHLIE